MIDPYRIQTRGIVLGSSLLAALLLLVGTVCADAQTRDRIDHRGRDFWAAFLPTNGDAIYPRYALVIVSEKPTVGTITYSATGRVDRVTIPLANTPVVVTLDTFLLLMPSPRSEPVTPYTIHVQFPDEVTVYGLNEMRWSSDAFMALPNEALGTRYAVLSYPNTQAPFDISIDLGDADFPSQFAVIATENNTQITINPTASFNGRFEISSYSTTLQRGEVFLAQADGPVGVDLTGTEVVASKPVVVYGSHQRTNVPFTESVGRDHIVETLPPVDRWTQRIMLTPHYAIQKTVPDANIARILAAFDGTRVSIDSVPVGTLNARQVMEVPLDRAKLVTASAPILVAQYNHSTVDVVNLRQHNDSLGDPFMILIQSPEQFDSVYTFESFATADYIYHAINVVIPTERVSSLLLDNQPVTGNFIRIPKTSYSYAQLPVSAGHHHIRARAPFGLYIYGYGPYNSYGYPGGMVLDTLFKDQKEPRIWATDTCGGAIGAGYDDSTHDFGMEDLRLLPGSRNVTMRTYPFRYGDDSIHFRLDLIDPYQDGSAELIVVDTAGLDARTRIPVKGFTVAIDAAQTAPIRLDTLASLNGQRFCRTVTLYNYGGFPQTITGLRFDPPDPRVTLAEKDPVVIPPGGRRDVTVCFEATGDTAFSISIAVTNGCIERTVAFLPLISGQDSVPPVVQFASQACERDVVVDLLDEGLLNSGIATIASTRLENAELVITPSLPTKQTRLRIKRIDQRKDLIYAITVRDAVGLESVISDTVGGFTLAVQRADGAQVGQIVGVSWEFPELIYSQRTCDTLFLENYGLLPLDLQRIRNLGNLQYSIPPEQLPIMLEPGERRGVAICVTPFGTERQVDTLVIDFGCGFDSEIVPLHTEVEPLTATSRDRCNNAITFSIGGFAKRNFLSTPTPNPVGNDLVKVTIGLTAKQPLHLAIHDERGVEVRRLLDGDEMPGGLAQIDARVGDLPMGIYYLRMTTAAGELMVEKLVISR